MSTIYVTLGKKRYVGGTITELYGKDISSAVLTIALGTDATIPPANANFVTPDVNTTGATNASRVIKKLVDSTTAPGTYFVWANISDSPEIEPIVLQGPITVA